MNARGWTLDSLSRNMVFWIYHEMLCHYKYTLYFWLYGPHFCLIFDDWYLDLILLIRWSNNSNSFHNALGASWYYKFNVKFLVFRQKKKKEKK
jgi:hypothetical protein